MGFSLDTLLQDTREAARLAFDAVTETFYGKASTLRDGTEHAPVSLPRDLAAHSDAQTEWWYYTGQAKTDSGREFGIELVFFKRRTDLDNFSVVPLRLLGNPFYFAHFAITDITRERVIWWQTGSLLRGSQPSYCLNLLYAGMPISTTALKHMTMRRDQKAFKPLHTVSS